MYLIFYTRVLLILICLNFFNFFYIYISGGHNELTRYSSEDVSGNESSEALKMTETERQATFNRHKEEMQKKRRKKKRTSSSLHSSTFQGTK